MRGISCPYPAPLLTLSPTTLANALLVSLVRKLDAEVERYNQLDLVFHRFTPTLPLFPLEVLLLSRIITEPHYWDENTMNPVMMVL